MSSTNSSSPNHIPRSARGLMALGAALLFSGILICMSALMYSESAVAAPPAGNTTLKVVGGHLDWSFAGAFGGPAATERPAATASGGATANRDGSFRFTASGGTYDDDSGAATVRYRGTVALAYPGGTVTLANPTIVVNAGDATLRADVAGPATVPHAPSASPAAGQSDIGDLRTYGIPPVVSNQTVTWSQVPAVLTETGAQALPGAPDASAGTGLGTVTFAATLQTPADAPVTTPPAQKPAATQSTTSADPSTTPTPCASETTTPTASASATATPTPTPTGTDCASPDPSSSTSSSSEPATSSNSGGNDTLAKTGSRLAPLMALGAVMTIAGGVTMLVSRRRGFTATEV